MGGGGDTVTNTGLGDEQFNTLTTNQANIGTQVSDLGTSAQEGFDTVNTNLGNLGGDLSVIGSNLTGGFTNLQDLMSQYNTATNTRFDTLDTGQANTATSLANNAATLGNIQGDVTTGFNDMGNRFDTVDTNVANVQGAVDQGFTDTAQGFADAQADRDTQFAAAADNMATGFGETGAALEKGFGDASTQLTNTQQAVEQGQGSIQDNLDALSTRADTYATQQLQNQADMQSGQDEFRSTFDNFTDRYSDDTELAQQSRADLALAQSNQTQNLREDLGSFAQAAATGQQGISDQLNTVQQDVSSNITGGFNQTMRELANLDAGQVIQGRNLARIAADQSQLDMDMRNDFYHLGSSFDDQGKLIPSSIDAQGNTLTRSIGPQGNLLLNTFNVRGQNIGSRNINVANRLNDLTQLQSMGNLTPSAQVSGFAGSPYAQTG